MTHRLPPTALSAIIFRATTDADPANTTECAVAIGDRRALVGHFMAKGSASVLTHEQLDEIRDYANDNNNFGVEVMRKLLSHIQALTCVEEVREVKTDFKLPLRAECVYTSNTEPEGYAGIFDATGREIAQVTVYGTALDLVELCNRQPPAPSLSAAKPVEDDADNFGHGVFGREGDPPVMVYTAEMARGANRERSPSGYFQMVMFDAHQRALDTLRAQLTAREPTWQPIVTAPRDGTAIWAHSQTHGHVVCWWEQVDGGGHPENGPAIYWWVSDKVEFNDGVYDAPTHWQPLPLAPISAEPVQERGEK